jgi:hypothetical protein
VSAEDHLGLKSAELLAWRCETQEWMHGETLPAREEVRRRPEHIRADEHAPFRPPQRDLVPEAAANDRDEGERADRLSRHDVQANTEPSGKRGAIAVMTIQQLDDPGRTAGGADPLFDAFAVDGIDQPDAAVDDERMRAAVHELLDDPAEAGVELVAEADVHSEESTGTP